MSSIVVENLSKRYVIGHAPQADTLRDALAGGVRSLWTRLRRGNRTTEEFWALRDVSFRIEPGEVVGIIGRNGAGKSTLLKILSRITEPTTGRVTLRGRVASLLEVGTGFHPELTGRENIFLNGAILGMSRAEIRQKFDEIVAFAEVERFLDTPVKRYSSGMYVRLAFAVAAHLDPEILIVDEVLAVGDAQFQKKCLGKMQDISRGQGRTVLFVSHNLPIIQKLCAKGILLSAGHTTGVEPIERAVASFLAGDRISPARPGKIPPQGIVLRDLHVASANPDQRHTLSLGAAVKLVMTLDTRIDRRGLVVTVAFADSDGQRVFALASVDDGWLLDLQPGLNVIEMDFLPPALFPGMFSLDIGVYGQNWECFLEAHGAAFITVKSRDENAQPRRPGFGLVRVEAGWNSRVST
jgi:lipopolysaccharide transport system ATP-binding protein